MKRSRYKGKMHLTTRLNIHYASIQGLYWIASASMYAFLVVFLDDSDCVAVGTGQ